MSEKLSKNDWSVIEHAIKEAMTASVDYQSILEYQNLLHKLHNETGKTGSLQVDVIDGPSGVNNNGMENYQI
jgi:hypothetical protein